MIVHARITVALDADDAAILFRMAREQCRRPPDQLRYLLREAGRARGWSPSADIDDAGSEHLAPDSDGISRTDAEVATPAIRPDGEATRAAEGE